MNTHQINTTGDSIAEQLRRAATPDEIVPAIQALAENRVKEAISPLIQILSHHHPAVRSAGTEALIQLAPESVEPLIAAYQASGDQGVQAYIIHALARIGDERSLELLVEVVGVAVANHCQGNVRRIAARGLGKIVSRCGDAEIVRPAVEKLIWALHNAEDWALRYAAAVSLQEIATSEALSALQQAQIQEQDPVVQVRIQMTNQTV